jgi:biotin carboxyl carrier protein
MTDHPVPQPRRTDPRTSVERAADHAALERLADGLLPALVAKLGSSGLGELEVREGTWKVRLRRPLGAAGASAQRRAAERPGRIQPGHAGHGHAPAAIEGRRAGSRSMGGHSTNGTDPGEPIAAERTHEPAREDRRTNALAPAVGVFRPGLAPGARVRAGDRVAVVDQLGIPIDVTSPVDGVVGATLVEAGDAVEYGEPVVVVDAIGADG